MSKIRLGLVFGGRSQEHEVSIMSARSVFENTDPQKYEIIPLAISKEGYWLTTEESANILKDENLTEAISSKKNSIASSLKVLITEKLDLAFPVLHGPYGEDGKIQGLLEMLNIPYVGAGVLDSALGMDKAMMKKIFSYHNLPQCKFIIVHKSQYKEKLPEIIKKIENRLAWPCFIKPANMGSSIGISKVEKESQLLTALTHAFNYDCKLVIEEYIQGRELECSVLGNEKIKASLPGEIKATHDFYDYQAKYQDESTQLIIPAKLSETQIKEIKELAIKAFQAIAGRGMGRVDFFLKNNKFLINEINTIPGFTQYSMYPKLWEVSGISYRQLIDTLVSLALKTQSI